VKVYAWPAWREAALGAGESILVVTHPAVTRKITAAVLASSRWSMCPS
jgi:hypothetical protein